MKNQFTVAELEMIKMAVMAMLDSDLTDDQVIMYAKILNKVFKLRDGG